MSDVLTFATAAGRLALTQAELVALADEVGAARVRGLDGRGLLHAGVDPAAAEAALEARGLDRSRAGLLGAEAAWVRQRLALVRLDQPGQRAALVLRHEADRLVSHLVAAGPDVGAAVSAVFDEPVTLGPLTTRAPREFVVEDLRPADLADRAWLATGLGAPGGGRGEPGGAGPAPAGDAAGPGDRALLPRPLATGLRDAVRESAADAADRLAAAGLAEADASALVADLASGPLPLVRVVAWRATTDGVSETRASWIVGRDRLWLVSEAAGVDVVGVGPDDETAAARTVAAAVGEEER